ncbi:MAG: hypothetical protein FWG83_05470, partial [Oscillospiraceae bacterium]|nr:hypothetical protein [Oscillospiraceae bacterium]
MSAALPTSSPLDKQKAKRRAEVSAALPTSSPLDKQESQKKSDPNQKLQVIKIQNKQTLIILNNSFGGKHETRKKRMCGDDSGGGA